MGFTDHFIKRPVLATVVSLLILLVGAQAALNLPIRQYPELSNAQITVTTTYPGANADLMQSFITNPIQQAIASTEGLDYMTSSSGQSISTITLTLRLDADADAALTEVMAKVSQVKNILPREANDPIILKQVGDGFALMYLSFNSNVMTGAQITDYIVRAIQPRLETLDGVSQVQILGGQTFAMRIWLQPDRMAALGVTASDVQQALIANNFTSAPGEIKGDYIQTTINAETDIDDPADFERLVVLVRDDTLIRLGDVAEIELGPESANSSSVFNGQKAVFLGVFAAPDANPLDAIQSVRDTMPEIDRQLPVGLTSTIAYDATEFIKASISEVRTTIIEAGIIVIVVIFLFLGTVRATIIPIVTIPLSLVGVMVFLLALGYSLNLLTLLAMVLAIGLVVDDAIVVVENITRHIEQGMQPFEASLKGAREIALPVISMTITLAAVYAPIGFVGGLTGTLFQEFAFTLAGAVIISGVIALTLSPMMCSRLLQSKGKESRFSLMVTRAFDRLKDRYESRLHKILRGRATILFVSVVILLSCGLLYVATQRELAPSEDQGAIFMITKAPEYANLDYLEAYTDEFSEIFKNLPETAHYFGINGAGTVRDGFAGAILKPWSERERSQDEVMAAIQPALNNIAGIQAFAFPVPSLPGAAGGPPVQFVVTSVGDFETLYSVVQDLQTAAYQSGLFMFANSDLNFEKPQVELAIDRAKANELGVTMQDIGASLSTLLGGNFVNRFNLYGRSYQVIPQVARKYRFDAELLKDYYVRTASGDLVPLSTIMTVGQSVQPSALTTFQQLNSATISAVMFPGRSLGEGLDFLGQKAEEIFPSGFSYDFQGESRQFVQEGDTLAYAFLFSLVVIFLVLAAQFESFRDPLIILISVPMSIFGALLFMSFGAATINIYTQIGLVTLIGLISKHGILMVEFANKLQEEEGLSVAAAIEKAAGTRLRPILMTTAAMVVGMVPLLIADGAGAKSRFDIGFVIASGMIIGTIFTLFVVPAMYTFLARDHSRAHAAGAAVKPAETPAE